jgi:hypothetical protein
VVVVVVQRSILLSTNYYHKAYRNLKEIEVGRVMYVWCKQKRAWTPRLHRLDIDVHLLWQGNFGHACLSLQYTFFSEEWRRFLGPVVPATFAIDDDVCLKHGCMHVVFIALSRHAVEKTGVVRLYVRYKHPSSSVARH